ncbi:MAG: thioredoxin family protein [Terracidiphilus sp.]|nr:thioredoxin family protein [Terracidiphilus sp.]
MKTIKIAALAALLVLARCKAKQQAPLSRTIYPDATQAKADVAGALKTAAATHKRVLLDFGGNWCGDCRALDAYFHDPANEALLSQNYVLVHVNIGHMDANLDLAAQYEVPLDKGVPALAVVDEHGALVYSQKNGQFEDMRHMEASSVREFLAEWKPAAPCSTTMVSC